MSAVGTGQENHLGAFAISGQQAGGSRTQDSTLESG